jgi:hypothetical protein
MLRQATFRQIANILVLSLMQWIVRHLPSEP